MLFGNFLALELKNSLKKKNSVKFDRKILKLHLVSMKGGKTDF